LTREQNSKPSITKDTEFKISLSREDIDEIAGKIRNVGNDSEKSLEVHDNRNRRAGLLTEKIVWLAWANFYDDSQVVKVFDSEEKAKNWETKALCLMRKYSEGNWNSSYEKARQDKEQFEELGLEYDDWCQGIFVERMDVE
jgi:hypothetical protein